jgi:hypothetical protein
MLLGSGGTDICESMDLALMQNYESLLSSSVLVSINSLCGHLVVHSCPFEENLVDNQVTKFDLEPVFPTMLGSGSSDICKIYKADFVAIYHVISTAQSQSRFSSPGRAPD